MVGACARKEHKDAFIIEIMPCTAKKSERVRQNIIDCAITVVELIRLFKETGITAQNFSPADQVEVVQKVQFD